MPQLRLCSNADRNTGARIDLLLGFQGGQRKGVGNGVDQDACIFPFYITSSNLDQRILGLNRTLEII